MSAAASRPSLAYTRLAPRAYQNLYQLSGTVKQGLLGARLVDLVFLRVSQINGCAFCMDMHWKDLVRQEVDPRILNTLPGWRESPFFDERERAALNWAERVSAIPNSHPDAEDEALLRAHFSEAEMAELGFVIAAITAWNLLNVSFRTPVPLK